MTETLSVAIAADHAGFELKQALVSDIAALGHTLLDLGTHGLDSVDYPDFGYALADAIASGKAGLGVGICGSGIGMDIAANRNLAVRAALCTSGLMARLARLHNDANVLILGARIIGLETARDCLATFLTTQFAGDRHQRRVDKLGRKPQ